MISRAKPQTVAETVFVTAMETSAYSLLAVGRLSREILAQGCFNPNSHLFWW